MTDAPLHNTATHTQGDMPLPFGSIRTALVMQVPGRGVSDDTWRHIGLMAAKVAYHGGANAAFCFCDTHVEVFDHRWVTTRLRLNRPGGIGGVPRDDACCRVDITTMTAASVMMFKRFIVGCGVLCPSITFWIEDTRSETTDPPFRHDICKFWALVWKTATQWLAHILPEIFIPPADAPCPAS